MYVPDQSIHLPLSSFCSFQVTKRVQGWEKHRETQSRGEAQLKWEAEVVEYVDYVSRTTSLHRTLKFKAWCSAEHSAKGHSTPGSAVLPAIVSPWGKALVNTKSSSGNSIPQTPHSHSSVLLSGTVGQLSTVCINRGPLGWVECYWCSWGPWPSEGGASCWLSATLLRVLFIGLVLLWAGSARGLLTLNAPANADFRHSHHFLPPLFLHCSFPLSHYRMQAKITRDWHFFLLRYACSFLFFFFILILFLLDYKSIYPATSINPPHHAITTTHDRNGPNMSFFFGVFIYILTNVCVVFRFCLCKEGSDRSGG